MSSHRQPIFKTFHAGADLSTHQNKFVKFGADNKTVVLAGAGDPTVGVLMNAPISGDPAEVALPGGGALIKLNATLTALTEVKSDSGGLAVAGAGSGDWTSAILQDGGVANDIVECYVVAQHKP